LACDHSGRRPSTSRTSNAADADSLREALSLANGNAEAEFVTINGAAVTDDAGGYSRVLATYYSEVAINDLIITGVDAAGFQSLGGIPHAHRWRDSDFRRHISL